MDNQQIAATLNQLADLLEFQGANAFRLRAYRNGARIIKDLPDSICQMLEAGDDLTQLDGIGKGVAQKCIELCQSGKLEQLEEILEEVPRSVLDLLNIPHLGPKKAAALFNQLDIRDLDQLKAACEAGKVQELSGFGKKTEQQILEGISIAVAANQRILWSAADRLAESLRQHMASCEGIDHLAFAGSYRRGKETVGDLDLLVTTDQPERVMDHFANFPRVHQVLARGETKMSVRLDDEFQIDLRVVPDESFGAALQYFTGSKEHNVELRGRARQRNLKVNEWGVFQLDDDGEAGPRVAGATEEEVYAALDLPCFPPEIREARREFEWAAEGELPPLITLADLRGDLHMHTTATDGKNSITEMAAAARQRGLEYIAITDHSRRVTMANGLDPDRLLAQWTEIDQLNEKAEDGFRILKGIECDILEGGGMDLPDEILALADWVIASVHYGQQQSKEQITARIIGAIENPHVDLIAHPTGRLINKRPPYDVDLPAVMQAAREHGTFLELNANPRRLDLNDVHLIAAQQQGIPIVINTDAHHTGGLDDMRFGLNQARRAALTATDVANTGSWQELRKRIEARA